MNILQAGGGIFVGVFQYWVGVVGDSAYAGVFTKGRLDRGNAISIVPNSRGDGNAYLNPLSSRTYKSRSDEEIFWPNVRRV